MNATSHERTEAPRGVNKESRLGPEVSLYGALIIRELLNRHWTSTLQEMVAAWALQRGCDLVITHNPYPPVDR